MSLGGLRLIALVAHLALGGFVSGYYARQHTLRWVTGEQMRNSAALLLAMVAGTPVNTWAQAVHMLSEKNSEFDTVLTVLRDESGFTGCGVQTSLFVRENLGFPVEGLTVNLVLSLLGPKKDVVNTVAKVSVSRVDPKTKLLTKKVIDSLWVGPASSAKPFRVTGLKPSPLGDGFFLGVGEAEEGWAAILSLGMATAPLQLQIGVTGERIKRVLQFTPPQLSTEEFRILSACVQSLVDRADRAANDGTPTK